MPDAAVAKHTAKGEFEGHTIMVMKTTESTGKNLVDHAFTILAEAHVQYCHHDDLAKRIEHETESVNEALSSHLLKRSDGELVAAVKRLQAAIALGGPTS